jgi:predicted acylesterase/phospholipase RssA
MRAFVLGGGGAKGALQAGALRALSCRICVVSVPSSTN